MNPDVFADLDQATSAALDHLERLAREAMRARGRFLLALSGGSTPAELYTRMGQAPAVDRLPWQAIELFFVDERSVGPTDPQSNYGMVKRTLLDHAPLSSAKVHRIKGELDPAAAALSYEAELRGTLSLRPDAVPRFDLILLGMGPDGHTASLFPHTAALAIRERLVAANEVPQLQTTRITLTPPVLNDARHVIFLVAGADKADALHAVLEGPPDHARYPAQLVQPRDGSLTWLVDRAAAARLGAKG
jgi:6-phosphogluconolactonase